ncbi:MAG: hypothetical protein QW101_01590 [Ignisphaera sp.]|uniref:Uncharacterized protein n=1 Tax=Ignisphaera aggregans TaxID=334771 RepID=A0A7J3MZE1_9CREN
MELLFTTLIATTFLTSSMAILALNLKLRNRMAFKDKSSKGDKNMRSEEYDIYKSVNSGYAYTVDVGDSLVVVVVVNKNNIGSSFLSILPSPIEVNAENYNSE